MSATLKSEGFWTPSSFDSHDVWSIRCFVLSQNRFFFPLDSRFAEKHFHERFFSEVGV